jgi:hypothetical protein
MSLRSCTISRVREGLEGAFFGSTREGVERLRRDGRGFEMRDWEGAGVAAMSCELAGRAGV